MEALSNKGAEADFTAARPWLAKSLRSTLYYLVASKKPIDSRTCVRVGFASTDVIEFVIIRSASRAPQLMSKRPSLSKGETEVARALWELGSASVRQVHEALASRRAIDFTTVQTYLRRLEGKGYTRAKLDGRIRIYTPCVKPRTVIRETVDDLIDRLFGGETMPLMRHLIEERGIDDDDLTQLRKLLDEKGT